MITFLSYEEWHNRNPERSEVEFFETSLGAWMIWVMAPDNTMDDDFVMPQNWIIA